MVPVLVSTCDLEDLIEDVMTSHMAGHFAIDVSNLVQRLCDSYNVSGSDELIDAALHGLSQKLDDYSPLDLITDMFIRLIDGYFVEDKYIINLEYEPVRQTIVVRARIRPRPTVLQNLIDEYKHAESQWDYVPERMRRVSQGLF